MKGTPKLKEFIWYVLQAILIWGKCTERVLSASVEGAGVDQISDYHARSKYVSWMWMDLFEFIDLKLEMYRGEFHFQEISSYHDL